MFFNKNLLFAFLGWLLLLFFKGYTLGIDDQQEILPYVLSLQNTSLYPNDFFISNLKEIIPNERYFFAQALVPFISYFDPLLLVFHAITTIALFMGLFKIARMFIHSDAYSWLVIYGSFILLYLYTLGGCELYYNTFQSSNVAKAIGIWAIYLFLQEKTYWSFLLLGLITYIQIIVGLDTALILSCILLIKKQFKLVGISNLIYFSIAGFYLYSILHARATPFVFDSEEYYQVLFEFRHPHHFIMAYFGLKHIFGYLILNVLACYYFFYKSKDLFYFILIVNIGSILYYAGVEIFHYIPIANFNFYKMTIWIKFFGCLATMALILKLEPMEKLQIQLDKFFEWSLILIPILFFGLIGSNALNLLHKPMMIGKRISQDPLVDISIQAKLHTPITATFIVPFDATAFKYYSERSSYVDFKANNRTPQTMFEWHKRIQMIYQVSANDSIKGFELKEKADAYFNQLNYNKIVQFKSKGITHILLPQFVQTEDTTIHIVASNPTWKIIQL